MKKIFTILFLVLVGLNNIKAATFSSLASGTWSVAATWTVTGTDTDGIPDSDDDVTINGGHTITMSSRSAARNLTVSATSKLSVLTQIFDFFGNFLNNGTVTGTVAFYFYGNTTFSSASPFTNPGDWQVKSGTLTINSGTSISKQNYFTINSGTKLINQGNLNLFGGSLALYGIFENSSNSQLSIGRNIVGSGTLNASFNSNTVTYNSYQINSIKGATYYNLNINGASTKSVTANVTVLNNLNLSTSTSSLCILNMNNFNLTVGGNWTNNANTTLTNQNTITFNGSGTQTISRASNEDINNMILSGSGTVLLGNSINVSTLTVNSGSLDVSASNFTVNVSGNLVNNGNINTRQGLFNFNGISAQTISGSSNTQFYALTLDNSSGAAVNSPQSVTDVLTVTNGNFNSNGNVTLISNASKTARLGVVGATGSFSGNMTIQKYVSARTKNWHDLSSPVQGTTIFDWDDEMYMSGLGCDCPVGIAGTDGNAGSFKSVTIWNEPTSTRSNITNSLTVLQPGKGYEVYLSDNMNNWNAKTFDSRGVPNYSTKNISLSYSGASAGLNLIGNPFASAIDFSLVSKINTDGHAYGYDNGIWTDYGTNAILTPHQGFYVYATSSGASISVTESSKSTVTATSFFRIASNYDIKLNYINSDIEFFNEAKVNIEDNTTEKWDIGNDALYFKGIESGASTLCFNTGDKKLLTNAVNDEQDEITLPIELFSPKTGLYYIQPSVLNIGKYKYIWIENIKTGEKFDLNKSIPVSIEEAGENNNFVLRLSKNEQSSKVSQIVFANDLIIFNSENILNLKSNKSDHLLTEISIFDLSGKLVLEQKNISIEENSIHKIDISSINQGVYIVNAIDTSGNSISRKIIK